MIVLNSENTEELSCTDLTRARNAAAAGASGVLLIGGESDTPRTLTPRIDPLRDDLASIETLNIPVGRINLEQGARAACSDVSGNTAHLSPRRRWFAKHATRRRSIDAPTTLRPADAACGCPL